MLSTGMLTLQSTVEAVSFLATRAHALPMQATSGPAGDYPLTQSSLQSELLAMLKEGSVAFELRAAVLQHAVMPAYLLPGLLEEATAQLAAWLNDHAEPTHSWRRPVQPGLRADIHAYLCSNESGERRFHNFGSVHVARRQSKLAVRKSLSKDTFRSYSSLTGDVSAYIGGAGSMTEMTICKSDTPFKAVHAEWTKRSSEWQVVQQAKALPGQQQAQALAAQRHAIHIPQLWQRQQQGEQQPQRAAAVALPEDVKADKALLQCKSSPPRLVKREAAAMAQLAHAGHAIKPEQDNVRPQKAARSAQQPLGRIDQNVMV